MEPLRIVAGDATSPQVEGPKIIPHVCNDIGGWGRGFVRAVSQRWPEPERQYRAWYRGRGGNDFGLGAVQLVRVRADLWVANMVGQRGIRRAAPTGGGRPPIRYEAVARCLEVLGGHAVGLGASVHMPPIGCGLAGGTWPRIEPLITGALCARGVAVTVYDRDSMITSGSSRGAAAAR
ncbi:Appr-1-p processing protein [Streptomyces sp. NPDC044571]|uniref:Appr-1-p processing protein n=1 Tax=Streptomyces sp. NPDC044571 TaxID=3155371 RepID=UPI0033D8E154